jgi:hypothetical protein
MVSPLALRTLTDVLYIVLLLATICAFGLTCTALLSQAVRTSPTQSWIGNDNTLVIGAGYVAVVRNISSTLSSSRLNGLSKRKLVASMFLCTKRRIAVRQKLNRISDSYQSSPHDVPQVCSLRTITSTNLTHPTVIHFQVSTRIRNARICSRLPHFFHIVTDRCVP